MFLVWGQTGGHEPKNVHLNLIQNLVIVPCVYLDNSELSESALCFFSTFLKISVIFYFLKKITILFLYHEKNQNFQKRDISSFSPISEKKNLQNSDFFKICSKITK